MKYVFIALAVLSTASVFAFQPYQAKKQFWEQNHLTPDGMGGYYNHKPGTGMWEDEHITPDRHGGFYIHKPGTGMWEDEHVTPDGQGGYYY